MKHYQTNQINYCVNSKGIKIPPYKSNTIFRKNKSFSDVIAEGFIFAIGTATALTIISGIIIAFINLIY